MQEPVSEQLTTGQRVGRIIAVVIVLLMTVGAITVLVKTQKEPEKTPREERGELVEVVSVETESQPVTVVAEGVVTAARQVVMIPEVSARVQWVNPKLIPGGRVAKGDILVRLDAREYRLRADQLLSQVDNAKLNLELERSRKEIAAREWELLGGGEVDQEQSLALRGPQMRSAEVAVSSARSSLEQAQLAVQRAVLRAPFNALVINETAELGQLAGPQSQLATLVGTDAFWVQVSLPVERLRWLQIPGVRGATEGSKVRITQNAGGALTVREGEVIRLLGELDPRGRMARVLVEIKDPLQLEADASAGASADLPLLIGSYVNVEIFGPQAEDVVELPRLALRDDDHVYVMNDDSTLHIKDVDVIWRRPESVLIRTGGESGLSHGDRVITSPIAAVVEGMKLRLLDDAMSADADDDADASGDNDKNTAGGDGDGAAAATDDSDSAQGPAVAEPSR
ncbi:efflux RND transporter periplasmic adaptor subunit [Haliangium ochraceum]|uniref:Efflux transporter, RND family, MFP subunit n=1 Tax=Haliangium ochraceum (strain DSM 14365 / JCM 11303 / SMP-2) TaxID=502025 RepID=D0LNZ1_HALO1|nr:efflux RND transporter periplasmic adaptor subunit [Haliangium ochraceum]ACY18817.1 efflux transporter, RND family, MFP subunit [Haliangium ochraceum DSM 14365]